MVEITIDNNKYLANPRQYRGLAYNTDINRNTKRFFKKYKKKIGKSLGGTVESMMMRRGQWILMLANAGGGKTYCVLETMAKLSMRPENKDVIYVIAVPNRNQSNQNEKSNVLSRFKAKSIVGSPDGKKKVEVNVVTNQIYSCVYDKALEVVEIINSNGKEAVLVLDECHKLIADNNFRGEAIARLEKACDLSAQVIMMTATPRRCLQYYKYDEIYHLIDEEAQNNIENFRVILSDNCKVTLLREISKIVNKKVTVSIVNEIWEDTKEIITPETLLELLEEPKYREVRRKTATEIKSKEVNAKALVRLNSIKEIDKYIEILNKAGIKAEKLTRKEKDGEVFKSIEEQSKIMSESNVVFCTSVIECGVSLENQDIVLVEMLRSARDFDSDNTVQFFARAREQICEGILIAPDYINKEIRANIKKEAKKAKENGVTLDEAKLYQERKKDFSKTKYMDEVKEDIEKYNKEFKRVETRYENMSNKHIKMMNELANIDYEAMKKKLDFILKYEGADFARKYLKDEIVNQTINNPYFINVVECDLDNLVIYIDNKKVIDKAFKELDKEILRFNPQMLLDFFEGKIFYDVITLEHHRVEEEAENNPELAKKYKDLSSYLRELTKAQNEIKAMKEADARALLHDEDFTKLLDDIVEGNIYKENIEEYTDKYSIRQILSFKESSVYKEYKKLIKVFDKETALYLLTVRVIISKALDKRYAKARKLNDKLTIKEFENNMNIVPEAKELRYLKSCELNDIIERHHFIANKNSVGRYQQGLADKHATILDVVLPAKKNKDGKLKTIRASKELLLKLNIELVDRRVYKDAEMEKAIKRIKREDDKLNIKTNLYSKANIKKLEAVYSSSGNNEIKMLNEISKVFNLAKDNTGFKINGVIKTFDMASIISNIH